MTFIFILSVVIDILCLALPFTAAVLFFLGRAFNFYIL